MSDAAQEEQYCCNMRRHYLVGVVAARAGEEPPMEVLEYIVDLTAPNPVMRIRFCPFCGERIDDNQSVRVAGQ